jgi:hypothetical protein
MNFILSIEPPNDPRYCRCPRCHGYKKRFLEILIAANIKNFLDGKDPFQVFPNTFKVKAVWHPDQLEADHWKRLIFTLREIQQWLEETHIQMGDEGAKLIHSKIKEAISFL